MGSFQGQDKGQWLKGIWAVNDYIGLQLVRCQNLQKVAPLKPPLFEQLPRAQIGQKSKKFSVHQIANDKTIMLSIENVQKVYFRPKLKEFEEKIETKSSIRALFEQLPRAQIMPKSKHYCDHQIANDKTIILSTENAQKFIPGQIYGGLKTSCGKIWY